jgi:hypothetical protein
MAGRADFTSEEWATMQRAVVGAPLLVATADGGRHDLVKELEVISRQLGEARARPASQLVAALADVREARSGFSATMSKEQVEEPALAALRSATAAIAARAPDELDSFQRFIVELATATAGASRSRLFGLAGPRVSEDEAAAMDQIRSALGLSA